MTDTFDKLKLNRKTLRSAVTKLVNCLEINLKNDEVDIDGLEENLNQLNIKSKLLNDVDKEIEQLTPLTEYENEKNSCYEYQDKISLATFRAQKKLKENNIVNNKEISSTQNTHNVSVPENNFIKLPKLIINKFSGDLTQFISFWNTFKTAIHENESLSKIERFNYLRSYLTSAALNAIEGLEISEDNYDAAIKILETRFGQKDLIINHHMNKLLNLSPVYKSNDLERLRKLHENIEINVRALAALGLEEKSYAPMMIAVILKALPNDLTLEWNRRNADNLHYSSVQQLLNFLHTEIISRERTFSNRNFSPTAMNKNKISKVPDISSIHNFIAATDNKKNKGCLFCKSNHLSENCDSFDVEKRKIILKQQGRCFLCLEPKHRINECSKKITCKFCNFRHNKVICYKLESHKKEKMSNTIKGDSSTQNKNEIVSAVSHTERNKILLQTCCVKIKNKNKEIESRMLLDTGSMRTFLSQTVVDKLNLKIIRKEKLSVFTFGQKIPIEKTYDVVKITLENKFSRKPKLQLEALVTQDISGSDIPPPPEQIKITELACLKDLHLADSPFCEEPITLLIGADYYYDIVIGNIKRLNKELVAVETIFGWCLQGTRTENPTSLIMNIIVEESFISEQIKKFWDLETSGLIDSKENFNASENEVMKQFQSEIKYEDNRYKVKLPWKLNKQKLNDNRKIATDRFFKLQKRFCRNPELFFEYKNVLQNYLKEGIIELVENEDSESMQFYLPHREVIKKDRVTSKLRIVFDASSHDSGSLSLNNCLDVGPNLYEDIFNMLCRFRFHSVAFTADMKQAFLQIVLDEEDRDMTRFLFTEDPFDESTPLLILKFTRILFGLNCSPFILAATIKYHLKKFSDIYPETTKFLNENVYVDDIIGSHPSVEKALSTCLESIEIFKNASMSLHKWHTNSQSLQEHWIANDVISDDLVSSEENVPPNKVLGLGWNHKNDTLYFDNRDLTEFVLKKTDTKRFVLQVLGRIFDPIGFLGPFTVRVKIIMQKIWSSGLNWDDILPEDLKSLWQSWCEEIPLLSNFSISRYYFSNISNFEINNLQMHIFSDASIKAFGTVAYFRVTFENEIRTMFIASKNRVAPLKKITLPRLELMAALLSTKLCANILKALKINIPCFYWTDSKIAYFWIKGSPERFKPFIKNRVEEIQKLSSPSNWHHCPGIGNPADLVTRGAKITKLLSDETWLHGPNWLCMPPEFWPKSDNKEEIDVSKLELRKTTKEIHQNECVTKDLDFPIDVNKYSNLEKLLRVTAWVKRFVTNIKTPLKKLGPLTAEEIVEAENFLIRNEQQHFFKEEYEALESNNSIKTNSPLFNFMPFIDERKLLRLGGRLEFSDLSTEEKHPVILPKRSWITNLIVRREHEKLKHGGTAFTLSRIRSRFWIPKGRQLVKSVIKNCLVCRKYTAKHADQMTAPMPKDRVTESPPFSICGLDFAGPIYIKEGKEIKKSYIVLFTCGVTRALHLELVRDMKIDSFLLAFRRFIARRGNCSVIYSDNAKTFKRAKLEIDNLYEILRDKSLMEFFAKERIVWKNIIERAAWWGGFYERLVKSVKDCIRKVIGKALLSYDEMTTLLVEVESVLNLRPLTYVYNENSEPNPLTPMHFLNFGKEITYPINFADMLENASKRSTALKRKRYQSLLLKQLWTKWKEQYLMDLKTVHASHNPTFMSELKEGAIVLIEGDLKNKMLWKLGKILKAVPGRDNKVRSYEVKTANGVLRRTAQHLYPFEMI